MPGAMLQRGFWLYVWRVRTPNAAELLYAGRTGDNSSPYATAPYQRMGQHLGSQPNQNALRGHLEKRQLDPECCTYELIAHGPLYEEVCQTPQMDRATAMELHKKPRDIVGAMEKALAEELAEAGYEVLNEVRWKPPLDRVLWEPVRDAFADHFPLLRR